MLIRDDINIRNQMFDQLNRTREIAEIRFSGVPNDLATLPPLPDARISHMATNVTNATNAFTLNGM